MQQQLPDQRHADCGRDARRSREASLASTHAGFGCAASCVGEAESTRSTLARDQRLVLGVRRLHNRWERPRPTQDVQRGERRPV
jgi:hypothetical protein